MASVASGGASPLSGYEFVPSESNGETDENVWTLVPVPTSSGPSSAGFFPSPGGSMSSWAMVSNGGQMAPSPQAPSPLNLDFDQQTNFSTAAYTNQSITFNSAASDGQFMTSSLGSDGQDFVNHPGLLFDEQQFNGETPFQDRDSGIRAVLLTKNCIR